MNFRKPIGKAAKFAFVKIPQGIVGWEINKQLFGHLRSNWTRATAPACPECERGVLRCDTSEAPHSPEQPAGPSMKSKAALYPWHCSDCDFVILATQDTAAVRTTVARIRAGHAQSAFSDMELQERAAIARRHRIGSRIFYTFAVLTFLNFAQMVAFNVSWIVTINWLSFSFMFAVFGMKKAYRAWQVTSGHLFEDGAFWHWIKHEKWLS